MAASLAAACAGPQATGRASRAASAKAQEILDLGVKARRSPGEASALTVPRLRELLTLASSGDDSERAAAAYTLGVLTLPPEVAAVARTEGARGLGRALAEADPETRGRAARAWGHLGLPGEALLSLAKGDPDWRVRVQAMRALARPGDAGLLAEALASAQATLAAPEAGRAGHRARWLHPLLAGLEAASKVKLPVEKLPAGARTDFQNPAATAALRCALAMAHDRAAGRVAQTPGCGDGLEPAFRGRMRACGLAAELSAGPTPEPSALALAKSCFADPDGRVRGAVAGHAAQALAEAARAALADADAFVVSEAASALASDPGLAKGSVDAALTAVRRLSPSRTAPAGDPRGDALSALADLLRAGEAGAQGVAALVGLLPVRSAPLQRSVVSALRAMPAPSDAALAASKSAAQAESPLAAEIPQAAQAGRKGQGPRAWGIRLRTTAGELVIRLRSADGEAPLTSAAVAKLVAQGFYNGLDFHRVVPDFVIQGGDPRGDGDGGPGWDLPDEHSAVPFVRGSVGIATSGPDTGGSQLFLCHSAQPHLDGRYTVVGALVDGFEVLDAIQVGDRILSAELVAAPLL